MVFQKLSQAISGLFRRDDTNPPAICYSVCNDVVRAVQVSGKSPEICAVNSSFMLSAGDCQSCIGRNSNRTYEDTILPLFKETLDYCEDIATNENKTSHIEALLSQESSLKTQLASLGYSPSSTRPANSLSATMTDSGNQVTVYRTAHAQTAVDSPGNNSNISTIVPAVVVPVFVVGIIVVLCFFFVRRRNHQKRLAPIQSSLPPIEKAQLHADEFRPELGGTEEGDQSRSELDGTEGTRRAMRTLGLPPLELPVQKDVKREDVTGELEGK
ncbi:hypothetical protein N7491_010801 [Penicillium cf. griseofulvum]|uniref:Uncharacterized protein n=1 Tax=Penicillium cf. griseofulvum TaxID=2972120 RepID=A0A9W9N0G7_9EURO|nr:hypothetical protein N7472_001125 [Penicillium cf. griseofulvum]KAJ5422356.1 hypothetical protein N7491_010801 [Penicillium cf. griseofulvum]KAJ5428539.1 hypothetical protein N7445_009993 [Penicillium cf. griseofulvum]